MPTPPHYVPVNEYVYAAALSGCVAGAMGSQPITSVNDETYGDTADNAVAFAEEFDTLWDGASLDVVQYEAILDSCAAYWRGRIPQSNVPEEYEFICDAIISMVNETDAAAIAAGATPPPWTGVAGGGNETIALPVGLVSVSSATILPAGALILRAYLEVTTPYSPGTTITLGQTGAPAEFMGAADSNPQAAAIYEVPQLTTAAGAHPLLVTVAGAPAAGAAVAVVEYAPSPSD